MSIDIRYITNGVKSGYYVRNSGVSLMTVDFYSKKEEIPESIRHYAPNRRMPRYWGPDMTKIMGCQKLLYPDWPKACGHPDFKGEECIAESCGYAVDGDWEKCPYFDKQGGK